MARNGLMSFRAHCGATGPRPVVATPFFMVYGAEAIFPPEVTMGSLRVKAYDEATQD
jgi:hypothetical protein